MRCHEKGLFYLRPHLPKCPVRVHFDCRESGKWGKLINNWAPSSITRTDSGVDWKLTLDSFRKGKWYMASVVLWAVSSINDASCYTLCFMFCVCWTLVCLIKPHLFMLNLGWYVWHVNKNTFWCQMCSRDRICNVAIYDNVRRLYF